MVEVPSAVMMLDHFAEEVDFFSIGTNDLIQYALAVDRSNKDVAGLYTAADPSVLRLINMSVKTAKEHEVPISMCGQMCGNPLYTMLLLGHRPAQHERHAGRDSRDQASLPPRLHSRLASVSPSARSSSKALAT